MAIVATQNPGVAGAAPVMASATAGALGSDKVPPGCRLLVVNGSGASINLTVGSPSTMDVDGLTMPDRVIAVPNGSFPANAKLVDLPARYADPSDGLVWLQWSAAPSVTFAVLGAQPS